MTQTIDRRTLLVGGGVGVGLVVAWTAWPRAYPVNLVANPDERVFGAWLKIGTDGHVTVAVPQAEHGQGVYTVLPQIVADELGADWRTVGVEAAPVNPLYANPLGLRSLLEGADDALPAGAIDEAARRAPVMLTGGSSSVRMFEDACRHAGAAARTLLCKAAARRWDVAWTDCAVDAGFVVHQGRRLRFADLAEAAAKETLPDPLPADAPGTGKLIGQSVPRIDVPAKVDGSANFAGDIRLPDMVHAAIRQAPRGNGRLVAMDRDAARRVRGVVAIVDRADWVAVVATTWWAADRGLAALAPRFETTGPAATTASIDAALTAALDGPGTRMAAVGDVAGAFRGARIVIAQYRVAPGCTPRSRRPARRRTGMAGGWNCGCRRRLPPMPGVRRRRRWGSARGRSSSTRCSSAAASATGSSRARRRRRRRSQRRSNDPSRWSGRAPRSA